MYTLIHEEEIERLSLNSIKKTRSLHFIIKNVFNWILTLISKLELFLHNQNR